MNRLRRWSRLLGRRGTTGVVTLLLGLAGAATTPLLDGTQAHYIHVRWSPKASEAERQALERRHGLRWRSGEDRSIGYDIVNESSGNIEALIGNPLVEDTHDLDRGRFLVAPSAPLGLAKNGWAWWWGLEARVPLVAAAARMAFVVGLVLLFVSRPMSRARARAAQWLPDPRNRETRRRAGLAVAATGLLLAGAGPFLRGGPSHTVVIRWADGVSADTREEIENRRGLRERFNEGRVYTYDLVNDSKDDIRALAAERAIERFDGIDRDRATIDPAAPVGTARTGLAWRWGLESHLSALRSTAAGLMIVGAALIAGVARLRQLGLGVVAHLRHLANRARTPTFVTHAASVGGILLTLAIFLLVVAFRWAALGGLGGDDHWSLWTSATFLAGDRPFQQFVDPGDPLYWAMSAFAQWVVGYRAIGEVALGFLLMGVAVAACFGMSWRSGGALFVALGLTVMAALLVTPVKLYSYPKVFLYPLGVWSSWRYIDKPGLLRGALLALAVAVAFGYRHDHGAYLSIGASAAVLAAHWKDGFRAVVLSLGRVGVVTILILSPYFALAHAHEGLVGYFRERIHFAAQTDAAGRRAVPFVVEPSAPLFFAIPPQPSVDLGVSWATDFPSSSRAAIEKRYQLEPPESARVGGWSRYFMTDYSTPAITALLAEPMATSVDGVEGSFRRGYVADEGRGGVNVPLSIAWLPSASPASIADAERRYRLSRRSAQPSDATVIAYDTDDRSVDNLTALHQDPAVGSVLGMHFVRVPVTVRLTRPVPLGPPVSVRWVASLTPEERGALETRFTLKAGRPDPGDPQKSFWLYEAGDASDVNLTALATHPQVAAVDQLESADTPHTFKARPWTPPRGAEISVMWAPNLTDAERDALEQRYTLIPNHGVPDGMTAYRTRNAAPAVIRALALEPGVERLRGADPKTGRVAGESWFAAMRRQVSILRLVPFPRLFVRENAGVWLYYVAFLIPAVVLGLLAWDWWSGRRVDVMPKEGQKMFALAVLMGVANLALLRKMGYFPDHFDVTIVMGAWLLGRALRTSWRRPLGAAMIVVAWVATGVSVVAAAAYVDLPTFIERYELFAPREFNPFFDREKLHRFATQPPIDFYAPKDVSGDKGVIRYLYECTKPEDRIFVTSDVYTVPYYTQRRVVGHVFWANGFMANPAFEDRMIALMERDPVPFVFGVGGERPLDNLSLYPRVRDYVDRRFTERHAVLQDSLAGKVLWLLVDERRTPVRTYEKLGLPCFR